MKHILSLLLVLSVMAASGQTKDTIKIKKVLPSCGDFIRWK